MKTKLIAGNLVALLLIAITSFAQKEVQGITGPEKDEPQSLLLIIIGFVFGVLFGLAVAYVFRKKRR